MWIMMSTGRLPEDRVPQGRGAVKGKFQRWKRGTARHITVQMAIYSPAGGGEKTEKEWNFPLTEKSSHNRSDQAIFCS